jgi:hypothetical protein
MLEAKYYDDVDECPVYFFFNAIKGDFSSLRIKKEVGSEKEDIQNFSKIWDSYLSKIGLPKKENQKIDLMLKITKLNCDFILKRDFRMLNKIEFLESKLEKLNKESTDFEESSLTEIILFLSKKQGYHIDKKKITVTEYYTLLK